MLQIWFVLCTINTTLIYLNWALFRRKLWRSAAQTCRLLHRKHVTYTVALHTILLGHTARQIKSTECLSAGYSTARLEAPTAHRVLEFIIKEKSTEAMWICSEIRSAIWEHPLQQSNIYLGDSPGFSLWSFIIMIHGSCLLSNLQTPTTSIFTGMLQSDKQAHLLMFISWRETGLLLKLMMQMMIFISCSSPGFVGFTKHPTK